MLTIPPARRAREAARAEEIQAADRALIRERLWWFAAGLASVWVGLWMVAMGFHSDRLSIGLVWVGGGILMGEVGPFLALLIAVRREEM
jgi:hypothetical protein